MSNPLQDAFSGRYKFSLIVGLVGLMFLFIGDVWMMLTSLVMSVGLGLIAYGEKESRPDLRWLAYGFFALAVVIMVFDTLQDTAPGLFGA